MDGHLNGRGVWEASVTSEALFPTEPVVRTLCSGQNGIRGQRNGLLNFGGGSRQRDCLGAYQPGPSSPDLATFPVSPKKRMRSRGRERFQWTGQGFRQHRRRLFSYGGCWLRWRNGHNVLGRDGKRPENCADPAWAFRALPISQALIAQKTGATTARSSGINDAERAITFWSAFLRIQRLICWATEGSIWLRAKNSTGKSTHLCSFCPLGRTKLHRLSY